MVVAHGSARQMPWNRPTGDLCWPNRDFAWYTPRPWIEGPWLPADVWGRRQRRLRRHGAGTSPKRVHHQRISGARDRHRFARSSDRVVDRAHQRVDGSPTRAPPRPPLAARLAENGRPPPQVACLPERQGCGTVPRHNRSSRTPEVSIDGRSEPSPDYPHHTLVAPVSELRSDPLQTAMAQGGKPW